MEVDIIQIIDETTALMLEVADEELAEVVKQFEDLGDPEALLGKPYEQWTTEDRMMLAQVYGALEPNPLSNLIFRKEYKRVRELEAEEV